MIFSNVFSGKTIHMQCKKELWLGVIESLWGKLGHHSCYLKLEMTLYSAIKTTYTKTFITQPNLLTFQANRKLMQAYLNFLSISLKDF